MSAVRSPVLLGGSVLSLLLFFLAAFSLLFGAINAFSLTNPQPTLGPVTVVLVAGATFGALLFAMTVGLLSLAR